MNEIQFEKKVKSMTIIEIFEVMIESLKSPKTIIDMGSFGCVRHGVCYGCAATNTILSILDSKPLTDPTINDRIYPIKLNKFVDSFESAIDYLRSGQFYSYRYQALLSGFAPMPEKLLGQDLPILTTTEYEEYLPLYEEFLLRMKDYFKAEENENSSK